MRSRLPNLTTNQGPPAYDADGDEQLRQLASDLAERSKHLRLDGSFSDQTHDLLPTPDEAWVHLKLLHAIYALKSRIQTIEGLFGLPEVASIDARTGEDVGKPTTTADGFSAILAEKRWAVFVARAVARFAIWWDLLRRINCATERLTLSVLRDPVMLKYWIGSHGQERLRTLDADHMPPLDVLMVWHAYMLYPRKYLEDSLRLGRMTLPRNGMPWAAVNACFGGKENYNPPAEAIKNFQALTNLSWDNLDDTPHREITCPTPDCRCLNKVPWTTLRREQVQAWVDGGEPESKSIPDVGYADKNFKKTCTGCGTVIDHDRLGAARFMADIRSITIEARNRPWDFDTSNIEMLPGTILNQAGLPSIISKGDDARLIPLRFLYHNLYYSANPTACRHAKPSIGHPAVFLTDNLATCRTLDEISDAIDLTNEESNIITGIDSAKQRHEIIHQLLLPYRETSHPFSLDLAAAVHRQGVFVSQMVEIDFLYSPFGMATMARLALKFEAYMTMMAARLDKVTVPTLDVDLMWHTRQLRPMGYYELCMRMTEGKCFIDHDDSFGKGTLSNAFEVTAEAFKKMFGVPFSMCTCIRCEGEWALGHPAEIHALLMGERVASIRKGARVVNLCKVFRDLFRNPLQWPAARLKQVSGDPG